MKNWYTGISALVKNTWKNEKRKIVAYQQHFGSFFQEKGKPAKILELSFYLQKISGQHFTTKG